MGLSKYLRGIFLVSLGYFCIASVEAKISEQCGVALASLSQGSGDPKSSAFLKHTTDFMKRTYREPTAKELIQLLGWSRGDVQRVSKSFGNLWSELASEDLSDMRAKVAKAYAKAAKRTGRIPTLAEVSEDLKIDEATIEKLFGSKKLFVDMADLKALAIELNPKMFDRVIDTDIFNEERLDKMVQAVREKRNLVLTTAVSGAPLNADFYQALQRYAKAQNADILVYAANMETRYLPEELLKAPNVHIITHSVELTPYMELNRIKLLAKQIEPLRGLDRIGERGQSLIVGSPKMHVKTVATVDNAENHHRLFSTGAVTDPNYAGELYVSGRTDEIATHDHMLGAMVLERATLTKENDKPTYHVRHIEYIPEKKGFMDLTKFYSATGVEKVEAEAMVLGDIHVGDTDADLEATFKEQIKKFKPKVIALHDVMNGHSVNHHDQLRLMTLADLAKEGRLDVEKELQGVVNFINRLTDVDPDVEIVVIPSNHDFWLTRWLESGQFMREPHNTRIGIELAGARLQGQDPLEYAVRKLNVKNGDRVRFLKVGESYKVTPRKVELGLHGHAGANGAKSSMASVRRAVDRAVTAHTHTYGRANGIVNVGTSTELVLRYNKEGFSNWVQTMAIVGPNGEIQNLEFENGEWFKNSKQDSKDFFPENYPRVIPNSHSDFGGVGQVDQYSRK